MRKLLRNRRGSVAFATVVALVPLIGVVALGGEAGHGTSPSNRRRLPPMRRPIRAP